MLSQKDQKKINSKLRNIYGQSKSHFDINYSLREIVEIIRIIKLYVIELLLFFLESLYSRFFILVRPVMS